MPLEIEHFTDPACPFAFSAEPIRWRLRWHYGDQLSWHTRMIVLTLEPGEGERLAEGAPNLQRAYGMPIDPAPYPRPVSSEPACRAVVAARLHARGTEETLLRRLRVRTMVGGLLDDPELIGAAALDVGLDPRELDRWCATEGVREALQADIDAARSPSRAARARDDKLGGPAERRRYTAPSYEITHDGTDTTVAVPGFNPFEAYETAVSNLAPELVRRPKPATIEELLAWAGEPLATAEVAAVAQVDPVQARVALGRFARPIPAGADFYWEATWARVQSVCGGSSAKPGCSASSTASPTPAGADGTSLPAGIPRPRRGRSGRDARGLKGMPGAYPCPPLSKRGCYESRHERRAGLPRWRDRPSGATTVPVTDEGFLRGDGAFEVIRVYGGKPFALDEHFDRMERSSANLRLAPFPREAYEREIPALLQARGGAGFDGCLRLVYTREGRRLAMTEPAKPWRTGTAGLRDLRAHPRARRSEVALLRGEHALWPRCARTGIRRGAARDAPRAGPGGPTSSHLLGRRGRRARARRRLRTTSSPRSRVRT